MEEMIMKTVKLYNGVEMPAIMLGPGTPAKPRGLSWMSEKSLLNRAWMKLVARPRASRNFIDAVANGIRAGFRGVDFSAAYGCGGLIADAIEQSGVSRKEVFLTGRISNSAQFKGRAAVEDQVRRVLDEYQTEYFDILMFHWPVTNCYETTWKVICEAYEKGLARSIGVANCHPHHLKVLMNIGVKPMVNQFEIHPLFTQKDLIKYNQDLGIVVEAYTPIARNDDRLMRLPKLRQIAANHGKTPVQVILRWHMQQDVIPIIKSLNYSRQKENLDVFDFELSPEEMSTIDGFNINSRLRYDPDNCDFTIL